MTVFWLLAVLMTGVALAFVLVPLARSRARAARSQGEANLEILRGQRRELDADVAAGTLSPAARDEALAELVARAEGDLDEPDAVPAAEAKRPWAAIAVVGVAIPALAIGLYLAWGTPSAINAPEAKAEPQLSDPQIAAMVDSLSKKVRERPDDLQGWSLLARSMGALGRYREAAEAYAHLAKLAPDDANVLADWADAAGMAQGRDLTGRPYELVKKALAIDPKHPKALALAGTAALNEGDFSGAIRHWEALKADMVPGSEDAQRIDAILAEIRERTGATAQKGPAPPPLARSAPPVPGGSVSGTVTLSPALAAKVAPGDTMFIYARADGGSRMPLAILRASAAELPRPFVLDDSMGMAAGVRLSTTPSVVIEARISKSGGAMAQPGDLTGTSAAVKPGAKGVAVAIDRVVP